MSNQLTLTDTPQAGWTGLEIWHASTQLGVYSLLVQIPYVGVQTAYTYTDSAGLTTDWYEARRYGPGPVYGSFSPAWSDTVTLTRRSLANCRRVLAERIGGYSMVTTDSAAPDTMSIVASDLAGGLDSDAYRQAWVYPTQTGVDPATSAFKLRRAGSQALNVSTGQLSVTVGYPVLIGAGVDVEIHTLLPPTRHDKLMGLRGCLNAGLAELWTYARLNMTGVNGQPAYDLSTLNEWLEADAINDLYGPALDPTLNAQPWPSWGAIQNSDSIKVGVSPTFSTGDAATVGVFRPADTWTKVAGVWGSASFGLGNDSDEQLFNPEVLVFVALRHAYHALSTQGEASERQYYMALEQQQRAKVGRWKLVNLPRQDRALSHSLPSGSAGMDAKDFSTWGNWG